MRKKYRVVELRKGMRYELYNYINNIELVEARIRDDLRKGEAYEIRVAKRVGKKYVDVGKVNRNNIKKIIRKLKEMGE